MEAGDFGTVAVSRSEVADHLPTPDPLTGADAGRDRLVRRPNALGVVDTDHPLACDGTGIPHHSIGGGEHLTAFLGGEIDAAMPSRPPGWGHLETPNDPERPYQWP